MRIGFTGHQNLPVGYIAKITGAIRQELEKEADLIGLSSLADGADQIFAQTVLAVGGSLEVVIPSAGYETTFSKTVLPVYQRLLTKSARVRELAFDKPSEEAFFAAGKHIVENSDRMIAVWDGEKAGGLGGTADVVQYAQSRGVGVTIIWPEGATRA